MNTMIQTAKTMLYRALRFLRQVLGSARRVPGDGVTVGLGTVRTVNTDQHIWIEVSSVQGDTFIGRLVHDDAGPDVATLRPGLVILVAFDPAEREQLSLPDDVLAVRASGLVFA